MSTLKKGEYAIKEGKRWNDSQHTKSSFAFTFPVDSLPWSGIANTALFSAPVALFYKEVHFVLWLQSHLPREPDKLCCKRYEATIAAGHFLSFFFTLLHPIFFLSTSLVLVSRWRSFKKRRYCFGFYYQLPLKPEAVKLCLQKFQRGQDKNFKPLIVGRPAVENSQDEILLDGRRNVWLLKTFLWTSVKCNFSSRYLRRILISLIYTYMTANDKG